MSYWCSVQQKYHKFAGLTRLERILLIHALILLPITRLCRWMGIKRSQKLLGNLVFHFRQTNSFNILPLKKARQADRMVSIAASRTICRTSCLDRSLTLMILLHRLGIDSDLHLGVRKDHGIFEAHAWVELNGVVLNDTDDVRQRFSPVLFP